MSLILSGTDGLSDIDGSASTPAIRGTDTNTGIFFPAADTIAFAEGGVEAMRIDSSGHVGIGTSSPSQELHVYRDQNATTEVLIENPNAGTSGRAQLELSPEVGSAYFTANSSTSTVSGIAGGALGAGLYTSSGLTNGLSVGTTAGPLKFFAGSTSAERARIDSSGNFFVNQTSLTGAEKVGISFDRTSQWGMAIKNTSATSPSNATYVSFYYTSTNTGSINSTGTTTSYGTSSDYRLKENIEPMTGALNKVSQLKPCTYVWKSTGEESQGFIAHELQEVVPECVTGEKDAVNEDGSIKPQGIDTSFLVATLTAAIQEQQALIQSLTARIAALEAKE